MFSRPPISRPHKGRGAVTNAISGRFDDPVREEDGDWLDQVETIDQPARLRTQVIEEFPRTILTRNDSPDVPFDRSVNAYRGCEHGCIYCYARPTHAWHGLSPGLDFETKLFAKPDAPELLRKTLAKPTYQAQVIALGTNTDPYQPIEDRYRITRGILELMLETSHPVAITTKSARIIDDLELLRQLAASKLIAVALSVTTLDPLLARRMEPRASSPEKRLEAVQRLADAGVPVWVNIAPVIPGLTDHELEHIAEAAANAGARGISTIPVRLPHEVAPLFQQWLQSHYPDRANKVMAIIRSLRGGRANDSQFFSRMRGEGPWAELLASRLTNARRRFDLPGRIESLRTDLFQRPKGSHSQLELF